MRKNAEIKKVVFCVAMMIGFFACNDDDDSNTYIAYGIVQNYSSPNNYDILTDDGEQLRVLKSHTTQTITDGMRLFANFNILSEEAKDKYTIELNGLYQLLSKPVITESFIRKSESIRRDSIGNDAFAGIKNIWFGGGYININFLTWHTLGGTKHLINLVYDDINTVSDTIKLSLCHNAYKEVPSYDGRNMDIGYGRCSFPIDKILSDSNKNVIVKLTWKEYDDAFNLKTVTECIKYEPNSKNVLKNNDLAQDVEIK